jgi:hypothetical protein
MKLNVLLILFISIITLSCNGQILFEKKILLENYKGATHVDYGDLDNDGDLDIVCSAYDDGLVDWLENKENGIYEKHNLTTGYDGAETVHIVDMDLDGDLDILSCALKKNKVSWFENIGNLNFVEITISTNLIGVHDVWPVDIDQDNDIDVVGAGLYDNSIVVYFKETANEYTKIILDNQFKQPLSVLAYDINNDGKKDVIGTAMGDGLISYWLNQGNQTFSERKKIADFDGVSWASCGDIDENGVVDLVAVSVNNKASWFKNDGELNFTEYSLPVNIKRGRYIELKDLNNDTHLDIILAAKESNEILWLEQDFSNQQFKEHKIDTTFKGADCVSIIDIDNDGDNDIIASSNIQNEIAIYLNKSKSLNISDNTIKSTFNFRNLSTDKTIQFSLHRNDYTVLDILDLDGKLYKSFRISGDTLELNENFNTGISILLFKNTISSIGESFVITQ